jgi:hypothetical protein
MEVGAPDDALDRHCANQTNLFKTCWHDMHGHLKQSPPDGSRALTLVQFEPAPIYLDTNFG